jgi:hypothetical protein
LIDFVPASAIRSLAGSPEASAAWEEALSAIFIDCDIPMRKGWEGIRAALWGLFAQKAGQGAGRAFRPGPLVLKSLPLGASSGQDGGRAASPEESILGKAKSLGKALELSESPCEQDRFLLKAERLFASYFLETESEASVSKVRLPIRLGKSISAHLRVLLGGLAPLLQEHFLVDASLGFECEKETGTVYRTLVLSGEPAFASAAETIFHLLCAGLDAMWAFLAPLAEKAKGRLSDSANSIFASAFLSEVRKTASSDPSIRLEGVDEAIYACLADGQLSSLEFPWVVGSMIGKRSRLSVPTACQAMMSAAPLSRTRH